MPVELLCKIVKREKENGGNLGPTERKTVREGINGSKIKPFTFLILN